MTSILQSKDLSSRKRLYWFSQIYGWLFYIVLLGIINQLNNNSGESILLINMLVTFVLGVSISHLYRELILRLHWLKLSISQIIPRVLLACLFFGCAFLALHTFISEVLLYGSWPQMEGLEILQLIINLSGIFVIWSLLYFLFHFIENYKKEEIKNLKWQAAKNEIELNKLKSQLNPHFIFNSMNSIRALVDEDPGKSKDAITKLSNILRSSLLMGRKEVIAFSEELELVNDYISLEKTRFEERLQVKIDVEPETLDLMVPPMMVQTLVENAIKHGISQLPKGGEVSLTVRKVNNNMDISIENSGEIRSEGSNTTGFGLKNTVQRLQLLYGNDYDFSIDNHNGKVLAHVNFPSKNIQIEKNQI